MINKKHGKSCSICYLIPGKNSKTPETLCYDVVDTIYTSCDNLQLSSRDLYAFFAKYLPFKRGTFLASVYYIL